MSRIGNNPVAIPGGVELKLDNDVLTVKGPNGELTQELNGHVGVTIEEGNVTVQRKSDEKQDRAYHGLYRSLISNMIEGVTNGFKTQQELVGVGYKAEVKGQILEMNLGYSHNVYLQVPEEIKVTAETVKGKNPIVTMESHDKQLLGQVAAKIRSLRKPEPFKGKGIRFVGEHIRRKAGKSAAKA
jgi:large subunit ribosomal protein L6